MAEFFKFLGQAVVVGIGWWVVHHLTTKRDRDKARREIVAKSADSLLDAAGALLIEARNYHLNPRDVVSELKIKMALQDLSLRCGGLADVCEEKAVLSACRSAITSTKRAITGKHFEDEHDQPLPDGHEQLALIAAAVLRTKECMLRLKHSQFRME